MTPGRTSELTSCQLTWPAFCSMTQKPQSPSGVLMPVFFSERSMSMSQASSEDLVLIDDVAFDGNEIHGVGHVEVIKFAVERAQVDGDGMIGAEFVQQVGLHLDELHDGVAAKPVPVQQQAPGCAARARTSASAPDPRRSTIWPQITQAQLFVEALDGFVFGFEPVVPFQRACLR